MDAKIQRQHQNSNPCLSLAVMPSFSSSYVVWYEVPSAASGQFFISIQPYTAFGLRPVFDVRPSALTLSVGIGESSLITFTFEQRYNNEDLSERRASLSSVLNAQCSVSMRSIHLWVP